MTTVDGFVVASPTAKKKQYIKTSKIAAVAFRIHRTHSLVECCAGKFLNSITIV